jgi:putative PIN family toxin of toxin-antitoxin system
VPSRSSAAAGNVVRVVVDTNVYIFSLNFAGTADAVLALGRAGVSEVFILPPIFQEIEGVLLRKFRWTAPRAREAMRAIRGFAILVNPQESVNVVREDESDNRILECALAARADLIVSGDQHLPFAAGAHCRRSLGSSVSRRPSPSRFRLSPATVSARPGNRLTQTASRITFLPLAITLPHDGT